jgi:hypothetical protein
LIAEEVAEVNPDLVAHDKRDEIYSVCYEAVNAMLLNEFLKQHRKVEEQQGMIGELKNQLRTLNARVEQQARQIQKVSAQLEINKAVPQMLADNP